MRRKGQQAENDKTERVTGLGRRTRVEIAKWNQMTALNFQTGGRHQTSPASLRGFSTKFNCQLIKFSIITLQADADCCTKKCKNVWLKQ